MALFLTLSPRQETFKNCQLIAFRDKALNDPGSIVNYVTGVSEGATQPQPERRRLGSF
jgi:hypothetical protein